MSSRRGQRRTDRRPSPQLQKTQLPKSQGRPRRSEPPAATFDVDAPGATFELECLPGLEPFVAREVENALNLQVTAGRVFHRGPLEPLLRLRTVVAVHRYELFPGQRPTVILGDQRFAGMLASALAQSRFSGFRVSSPGRDSAALRRVREAVATHTGLPESEDGDLLIRIRRESSGWGVLVRLTPRASATRDWRVADMPGALHATMAAAMAELAAPRSQDRIVNVCCGSGTLILECQRGASFLGVDLAPAALQAARANLEADRLMQTTHRSTTLICGDATHLPLADRSVDVLLADLPYGHEIGDHQTNRMLYPELISEAARVSRDDARMVVCTQELRLLEDTVRAGPWQIDQQVRVQQRRAQPAIYLLRKMAEPGR